MRRSADGRVGLGLRAHSGWAVLVALRDPAAAPMVVARRRLELTDRTNRAGVQPYHAASEMRLSEAEVFLRECAEASTALACRAMREATSELQAKGYSVHGACLLLGSGRKATDLKSTLASHAMIHTAEGDFFRDALNRACESCGVKVCGVKEKMLRSEAAARLRMPAEDVEQYVAGLRAATGPPWRQDEKLCATAAWMVLGRG